MLDVYGYYQGLLCRKLLLILDPVENKVTANSYLPQWSVISERFVSKYLKKKFSSAGRSR